MERTADGDIAAFGILFERHQERLVAFLIRFLGERALAEDIAQEAFWNIWSKRATFNPRQSFRVYLYVAAKNLALNERTSARHRRTVSLTALPERSDICDRSDPLPSNDPLQALLQQHLQCTIRRALDELPEDQRLCILLREYEGCSHQETARILGCSEVSARVLHFRARNRLKKTLAPVLRSERGQTNDEKNGD